METRPKNLSLETGIRCQDCELCNVESPSWNCIAGYGNRVDPTIMLVGERAMRGDTTKRTAFTGVVATKVRYLLERAGIDLNSCYFTNAVKCYNPKDAIKKSWVTACKFNLRDEIEFLKPKVIVTFGTNALHAVCGTEYNSKEYRGFPIDLVQSGNKISTVVPTNSIAQALNMADRDPLILFDLGVAKSIANGTFKHAKKLPSPVIAESILDVNSICEILTQAESVSFDLETSGLNPRKDKILCISFGLEDGRSFVIPYDSWNTNDHIIVKRRIEDVLLSSNQKIAQNGKFDIQFLRTEGLNVRNFSFDTMLAHYLCNSDSPHDLITIAQEYGLITERYDTLLEYYLKLNGDRSYSSVPRDILYKYAGYDAALTAMLMPRLRARLTNIGSEKVLTHIMMPLVFVLADMEYRGIRFNTEGLKDYAQEIAVRTNELEATLKKIVRDKEFKPSSSDQVAAYLSSKKSINLSKTTARGVYCTDSEVLESILEKGKLVPFCTALLEHREITKLRGTYLDGNNGMKGLLAKAEDGYLHTQYNLTGTYGGRLSSNDPNLQNIPKEKRMRALFMCDEPDDFMANADYKQLEVRGGAVQSRDLVLIQEIRDSIDMHVRNASELLLGIPEEAFRAILLDESHPEHSLFVTKRTEAKGITFGIMYGSTAEGIAKRNKIPLPTAKKFMRKFFQKYYGLAMFMEEQKNKLYRDGMLHSGSGRVCYFDSLSWLTHPANAKSFRAKQQLSELERISFNFPIQSLCSDIFQTRKTKLYYALKKHNLKSRLLLSLHDGLALNVKPNERATIEKLIPDVMNFKYNEGTAYEVPFEVDVKWTKEWTT